MGWGRGTTAASLECVHAPQSPHRAARAAYVLRREQARPPRLMCCSLGLAFALQLVLPALPHPARWVVFAAISLTCLPSARTVPLLQGFLGLAFIVQLMLLLFHLKGPGIEVMVHLILGLQVGSFQHCLWAFFNRFSVFEIRFDWSADSWILWDLVLSNQALSCCACARQRGDAPSTKRSPSKEGLPGPSPGGQAGGAAGTPHFAGDAVGRPL